ncbi:hypothetical protein HOH15_00940, partial [Candidatus Woesearchaeota archaeon]|nr:hypothetical protein [Candidatus Woesearchaeota archaeon]
FPNILNNNSCNYDDLWFIVGENGLAEDIIAMNYVMGAITAYVENSAWCNPNIFNLGYELGNNQFLDNYFTLGKSANDVDSMLTEAELKMLKDEEFEYELVNDFGEKIEYEIEYKQRIRFENEENFIFTYEDNPGFPPEYSYYIAIDDSPSKPMYSYEVMFDNSVVFDINNFDEFEDQLVPLRFEMQGGIDAYITDLINDGSEITGMTFFAGDYTWLTFNEQKQVENKFGDLLDIEFVDYVINPETNEMVSAGFTINGLNVWIDVGTMESAFGLDFAFVYGSSEEEDLEEDKKVCKMILNAREIKLEEGKEVRINDEKISDISGFYATSHFIGNPGQWYGFSYQVNPDNDMIYFQMNDQIIDPVLEQFKFVFYDIAGSPEESENFELTASDNSGQLIFHNTDDMQVKLKVELDVDGNVYWGKLHTSDEVDEMYYFNGDVCAGQTEITECKGAMFLVSSGEEHEAHFVKLDKIDTVDHKISFEDKTYGTETNELSFISCVDQYVHLSGISDDLLINICEANNTVSFKSLGQGYSDDNSFVQFKTKNQGIVKLSLFDNDNTHPKVGDISFTESTDVDSVDHFIDGSSLENSLIFNFYYDLVNNALEINHNTEWENGADWINDFDNLNDDKLFVSSLKGTFISLDNDDSPQSVYIQHPQFDELYYARVFVAEADATTDVYSPNFGVDQIKLDTEVTQEEITNKNIVLVGRPTIYAGNNANPLIDNYELPELNPGDGFIGLRDNGNIDDNGWFKPLTALIVSGNTPQDVLNAGHIFNDYKYYDLDEVGQEAIVNDINGELVLIY